MHDIDVSENHETLFWIESTNVQINPERMHEVNCFSVKTFWCTIIVQHDVAFISYNYKNLRCTIIQEQGKKQIHQFNFENII